MLSQPELVRLSQEYLQHVRLDWDHPDLGQELFEATSEDLKQIETDAAKHAFWINIYNATVLRMLKADSTHLEGKIKRKRFFLAKFIQFKDVKFSLDDVEHGLLRRSSIWFSKGYLRKPFPSNLECELRVKTVDPRIHFALNCGGMGCPPIRFYDTAKIDEQLDTAARAFIYAEVDIDPNTVVMSRIFDWYIGDFGGRNGVLSFIRKYSAEDISDSVKVKFKHYDWRPWFKQVPS